MTWRVLEIFIGMDFKLWCDRPIFGARNDLRINETGNDRLIFPHEILVQRFD